MRELAERAWFLLCLGLGRLLRAGKYSTVRIVSERGELSARKHRRFYAPLLISAGGLLVKVLDTGVRILSQRDWEELASSWRPRLDAQIALLERLRDRLDGCIGCGCLSLKTCHLYNPDDIASADGPGPRWVLTDEGPQD